ncbi:UDP-glucose--hexose-1-phosphate uridylyltransferase [Bacillus sp. FJAT-49736]|uniref:UDP-glucose--hexose-1-phosphate uridylyltransferase n=1 Tax=Bacillus sp. FJAT-49736 TaxID=2833582 RepID=UPI001BC8DAAF|nr:UDP-glucose--hexose-1-phosphate uridylyltransferase [Bacillus sp. FJAT-49736]MBS4174576.1 UDP-glucose--hexose-1-phosphate uridylyltransferase [Bacillus sp. FJAT-49736]
MHKIYRVIQQLVSYALSARLIEEEDVIYARNQVLAILELDSFMEGMEEQEGTNIPDLLDLLIEYACQHNIIEDYFDAKEILASKIMNCFIARPSTINRNFNEMYKVNPKQATDYFYELSRNSNYIQTKRIQKNIEYKVSTEYGDIDITINLSKPEKDPKQIEMEKALTKVDYPLCLLCVENEGYSGRVGHPARSNHRVIRLELEGEKWLLQYSPYLYYGEHCIVLSEQHHNMEINRKTFANLLAFVQKFPHYFIGSNADLPIVGGSILSHDHYQGGCYEFPMAKAKEEMSFLLSRFSNVEFSSLKWPMSVLRLRSKEIHCLVEASDYILQKWKLYNDPSVGIHAFTNNIPHNTITPIARKRGRYFEMDLVLRNNRTDQRHPLGIFHPHADVHHIKKENIGLIEAMGLAVLPARLEEELLEVGNYLLDKENSIANYHVEWAEQLKAKYKEIIDQQNVEIILRKEVGAKFNKALTDASVFKRNEDGRRALINFIEIL